MVNYVLGPLLFIVLFYSIYTNISKQYTLQQLWQMFADIFNSNNRGLLIAVLLLMCANWTIEAIKWKILMRPVQKVSMFTACRAVLAGLSFSMFIPNGVGEYIGRTLYMQEGNRLRSVPLSIVGSISQLIVTLIAGVAGLFYLKNTILTGAFAAKGLQAFWLSGLLYAVVVAALLFLLIYFKISWFARWFEKIPFINRHKVFIENLEGFHWKQLTQILSLSVLRYSVFILQYLIVFHLFNVDINWVQAAFATAVLFLLLTVVPAVPNIAELGVRGEISRQLFGLLSANAAGIVFSAAFIWIVNLIIPALAGTLFIIGIKIFRNK